MASFVRRCVRIIDDRGSDQELTLREDGQERRLRIKGLAASGFLLAEDETGAAVELQPDATRLDLWENLLLRKTQGAPV